MNKNNCPIIFGLNIYTQYKVKHHCEYSASSPDYDDWVTREDNKEFDIDGGGLAKIISNHLKDNYFNECRFEKNKIYMSAFDPTTGWCCDDVYEFTEIMEVSL